MKNIFLIIASALLIVACGGSDDSARPETPINEGGTPDTETPPTSEGGTPDADTPPTKATLVFPEANSLCTEASNLTGNPGDTDRTYTINFRWNASANTSYAIVLKNEDTVTEITTVSTSAASLDVEGIIPGANYSWQVIASKAGTTVTTTSDKRMFIAAGIAEISFAPRAAVAVNPTRNSILASTTTTVTLEWTGIDSDNNISEYDIFFGESNTDPLPKVNTVTAGTNTVEVTVTSGTFYSWRIITKDEDDNSSTSATFKFAVE